MNFNRKVITDLISLNIFFFCHGNRMFFIRKQEYNTANIVQCRVLLDHLDCRYSVR